MENDQIFDIFYDCEPVADSGGSPIDCDPRLKDAPYTEAELTKLNEQRRLWSLIDSDEGDPVIALGSHVVNCLAWYVTDKPAPDCVT